MSYTRPWIFLVLPRNLDSKFVAEDLILLLGLRAMMHQKIHCIQAAFRDWTDGQVMPALLLRRLQRSQ